MLGFEVGVMGRAVLDTLRASAPTMLDGVLGRMTVEAGNRRIDRWSRAVVEAARIDLVVVGDEPPVDEALVVMSNHQSYYDIVCIYQALRRPMRMVAKQELSTIPVFGQAMKDAGFVFVDRSNRRRALLSMETAQRAVERGMSIWIAPEGTRSRDGQLLEFKRGGFHLALNAGARILPVTVDGTHAVMRRGSWRISPGRRVVVTLGEPIDPAAYGRPRLGELVETVRAAIAAPLAIHE